MFGLNLTSDLRKEFGLSLRETLGSALALGASATRFGGSSGRGFLLAASLAAGVIGGLVPGVLRAHVHALAEAASLSRADDRFQKLESAQNADAEAVRATTQSDAALQARLDTLEKRLAKVERANLDANATGAIAPPARPPLPPKPERRHKSSKD